MDERDKQLIEQIRAMEVENAKKYEPISNKHLTLREFAGLFGRKSNRNDKLLLFLKIGSNRPDVDIPEEIRNCFNEGNVVLDTYKGKGKVHVEYRVPIIALTENTRKQANVIISMRSDSNIYLTQATKSMLHFLNISNNTNISKLLERISEQILNATKSGWDGDIKKLRVSIDKYNF
jgi:hypothetical protein